MRTDPAELAKSKDVYIVTSSIVSGEGMRLVRFFGNPVKDDAYHEVDYNMGNYFDLSYLESKNLGHNIYIYQYTPKK